LARAIPIAALIFELNAAIAGNSFSECNPIEISTRTPRDWFLRVPWQRREKGEQ
jgi:hypothetical protein